MATSKSLTFILKSGGLLSVSSREGRSGLKGQWPLWTERGLSWEPQKPPAPLFFSPAPLYPCLILANPALKKQDLACKHICKDPGRSRRSHPPGGGCPNLKVAGDLAGGEGAGIRSTYRIGRAQCKIKMWGSSLKSYQVLPPFQSLPDA